MMQGLGVLKQQTLNFIGENPASVVFTRNAKASDGAGGTTRTPTPLPAQTVRIVQADENNGVERQDMSGEVVRPTWNIIAEFDADIQRGDTFIWQGLNAQVVWVNDLGYELMADVAVR